MRNFEALIAYLDSRIAAAVDWKRHDCVRFAGGAVKAMTGRDRLRGLGHRWSTERGANRVLKRLGGLYRIWRSRHREHAVRGDVGLVASKAGPALVIVEGDTVVGVGPTRLIRLPRRMMTVAWSAE